MKPKRSYAAKSGASYDQCQTPPQALAPLLPYLRGTIWEPAAGERFLVDELRQHGHHVVDTDITDGPPVDFFTQVFPSDVIVTNPPYSIKYAWLERCYALGRPFALLVPVETIGAAKAQRLMEAHGAELLLLDRRVNFKMPNVGWSGKGAQFPTCWLCWRVLPAPIIYGKLPRQHTIGQAVLDLQAA